MPSTRTPRTMTRDTSSASIQSQTLSSSSIMSSSQLPDSLPRTSIHGTSPALSPSGSTTTMPPMMASASLYRDADQKILGGKYTKLDMVDLEKLKFHELDKTLSDMVNSRSQGKASKKFAKKLLTICKHLLSFGVPISTANNYSEAVVSSVKALLDLELQRRENYEQIAFIYYNIIRTLEVLQFLQTVIPIDDPLEDRDNYLLRALDHDMGEMKDIIDQFGEFSTVYYRYKSPVFRFMFAGAYNDKLKTFLNGFQRVKGNLEEIIRIRGLVEQREISEQTIRISSNIDKMFELLTEMKLTPQQLKALDEMKKLGGHDKVCESNENLAKIAEIFNEKLTASLSNDLKKGLETILRENKNYYETMLSKAIRDTDSINRNIDETREQILERLSEGSYQLINDQDIRECWKSLQASSTVKSGAFVEALYEYFHAKLVKHEKDTKQEHSDLWVLPMLSKMSYRSALCDAIDAQGSGYISVQEANEFFDRRPPEWSVLEWIAFWAAGWLNNEWLYEEQIANTIDDIREFGMNARHKNQRALQDYLEVLDIVQPVITGVSEPFDEEADGIDILRELTQEYWTTESREMVAQLKNVRYEIDDVSMVNVIVANLSKTSIGGARMELSVLCLLSELLRHHANVVNRAARADVESMLNDMKDSLLTVLKAFYNRMRDLLKGWRRQRKDPRPQFRSFAYGLYYGLFDHYIHQSPTNARMLDLFREDEPGEYAEDVDDKQIIFEAHRRTELERRFDALENRMENFMNDVMSILSKISRTNSFMRTAEPEGMMGEESEEALLLSETDADDARADREMDDSEDAVEDAEIIGEAGEVVADDLEVNDNFSQNSTDNNTGNDNGNSIEDLGNHLENPTEAEDEEDDGYATPQDYNDDDDDGVVVPEIIITPERFQEVGYDREESREPGFDSYIHVHDERSRAEELPGHHNELAPPTHEHYGRDEEDLESMYAEPSSLRRDELHYVDEGSLLAVEHTHARRGSARGDESPSNFPSSPSLGTSRLNGLTKYERGPSRPSSRAVDRIAGHASRSRERFDDDLILNGREYPALSPSGRTGLRSPGGRSEGYKNEDYLGREDDYGYDHRQGYFPRDGDFLDDRPSIRRRETSRYQRSRHEFRSSREDRYHGRSSESDRAVEQYEFYDAAGYRTGRKRGYEDDMPLTSERSELFGSRRRDNTRGHDRLDEYGNRRAEGHGTLDLFGRAIGSEVASHIVRSEDRGESEDDDDDEGEGDDDDDDNDLDDNDDLEVRRPNRRPIRARPQSRYSNAGGQRRHRTGRRSDDEYGTRRPLDAEEMYPQEAEELLEVGLGQLAESTAGALMGITSNLKLPKIRHSGSSADKIDKTLDRNPSTSSGQSKGLGRFNPLRKKNN